MRWVSIFLAATACFFAILMIYEVTLNSRPLLQALDPRFMMAHFASSALQIAVSGVIFVLPLWLVLGRHMGDRPAAWAAAGAFGGAAMMLFAAVYASTCQTGTELCPAELQAQKSSFLLLAAVMAVAGAGAALAGLLAWRRTQPPPPGSRTDFRV